MSKSANAGELRTQVYFMRITRSQDSDGFEPEIEESIFADQEGAALPALGKWQNIHGSEVFTAMQLQLRDPVTYTTRYSPQYDITLIAYRADEYAAALAAISSGTDTEDALAPIRYEVISIDDVENRRQWLEIKLQRKVSAR